MTPCAKNQGVAAMKHRSATMKKTSAAIALCCGRTAPKDNLTSNLRDVSLTTWNVTISIDVLNAKHLQRKCIFAVVKETCVIVNLRGNLLLLHHLHSKPVRQIGRASCRERVSTVV